jgi:hypothetical protein
MFTLDRRTIPLPMPSARGNDAVGRTRDTSRRQVRNAPAPRAFDRLVECPTGSGNYNLRIRPCMLRFN